MGDTRILLRCTCGVALVIDEGPSFRINTGVCRIYKDTGRIMISCRRCPLAAHISIGDSLGSAVVSQIQDMEEPPTKMRGTLAVAFSRG